MSALLSLLLLAASLGLTITIAVKRFPGGLTTLLCLVLAVAAAWHGVQRRGIARILGATAAVLLLAGAVVLVVVEGYPIANVLIAVGVVASLAAARTAFAVRVRLPPALRPSHPVLFYNPRSGGGKAARFHVADEARRRGIEPVELRPGTDLEELVRAAVRDGADGLAMAGGDGSQAIVAAIASERGLPYACIPAGTRNHFALDLGVDREDVVGALDAFVDGGERTVDLAEVNGRVFVNNVSLGLYAEAVQRSGYREAKIRTLLETVPEVMGPQGKPLDLSWNHGGRESGTAILVSNNRYRLGHAVASGTRPRLDRGLLGIAVWGSSLASADGRAAAGLGWRHWSAPSFEIESAGSVPAGIDGEATTLDPPLRFRVLPGALRVRIAPQHPGASPSARTPDSSWKTIAALARLAFGAGRKVEA